MSINNTGYKYEKRSGSVNSGEMAIKYSLCVPIFRCDGEVGRYDKMNSFYMEILDNCLSFCQNGINSYFEACELVYSLDCRVTYNSDDIICITIGVTLEKRCGSQGVYKGSTKEVLQNFFHSDIWERGELLPPKIALSRFLPKGKRKKRIGKRESLMVDNGGVFLLKGDRGERVRIAGS